MNPELELVASQLAHAHTPEEVFGEIKAHRDEMLVLLQKNYRAMAKITHPDIYHTDQERRLAQKAFHLLTDWLGEAREKIKSGEYGKKNNPSKTILRTRKREYSVSGSYARDGVFNLYPCSYMERDLVYQALLKIARAWRDHALVERESRALRTLVRSKDAERFAAYLPNLLDHFNYEDEEGERPALVFEKYDGWYSLEDVRRAYPHGIDAKDLAWIWRRLLVVLGFTHANKILHGSVLPRNVWILPEEHGLMLVNWHTAVFDPSTTGENIQAVIAEDEEWYPREVWKGEIPSFGTDIHMSAKCMVWLLGGDLQTKVFPKSIPTPIRAFLKGCILPDRRSPQDAWSLKEEFDELLERLWGRRTFHPFSMK